MIDKLKSYLTNTPITLSQWIMAISGILMIRFFLESLSSPSISGIIATDAPTMVHYYLFFITVSMAMMLVLQFVLPDWKKAIPLMTLYSMLLIYSAPIIDWIVSGGKGFVQGYLYVGPNELIHSFFTFFGPYHSPGITIGIHIELAMMFLGIGAFVYVVRKNIWWSLVSVVLMYLVAYISVIVPIVIGMIGSYLLGESVTLASSLQFLQTTIANSATLANNIHGTLLYASFDRLLSIGFDFMMARIWFISIVFLVLWWFLTNFKRQTIAILKNSRPERALHYLLLALFGVYLAYSQHHFVLNWNDCLVIITLLLSFYFSWMFAVALNDVYDTDIDKISNTGRPLNDEIVSVSEMKSASFLFLVLGLVAGYLSGYYAFFYTLLFCAFYYIYSAPPIRIKVLSFICPLFFGLCSLAAVMSGFFTFSSTKILTAFPTALMPVIVIAFFLVQHIKDLKDVEGDRANGILTLPTMLGSLWGPVIVGIMAGFAYIIVALVSHNTIVWCGSLIAGFFTYWLCIRKNYVEWPIFAVYYSYSLFLVVVLILLK